MTPVRLEPAAPRLESSTLPLSHCTPLVIQLTRILFLQASLKWLRKRKRKSMTVVIVARFSHVPHTWTNMREYILERNRMPVIYVGEDLRRRGIWNLINLYMQRNQKIYEIRNVSYFSIWACLSFHQHAWQGQWNDRHVQWRLICLENVSGLISVFELKDFSRHAGKFHVCWFFFQN